MSLSYSHRRRQLEKLVAKLGISGGAEPQWQMLDLALTHPTISPDANYEELEFVGDAVVRLAAAEFLLNRYPQRKLGELAAIRSALVSDRTLAKIAEGYGLDRYLLVAPSAEGDKVGSASRLADALEAVVGALYLSTHTLELVRPWLDEDFQRLAAELEKDPALGNYKHALQEWTQARYKVLPEYRVMESKREDKSVVAAHPFPHNMRDRFIAEVWLRGEKLGTGRGATKKDAQQAAAKQAFLSLVPSP